jgi:hypothetical protein
MGIAVRGDGGRDGESGRPSASQNSAVDGSLEVPFASRASSVPGRIFDRCSLAACGLYVAVSVFFLGRWLIFDFAHSYVGRYADPSLFIWSIAWWPYAISHWLNPILTHSIFAPGGTNLAWTTTIPLASLIVWPITAAYGPIVPYNILALLAPALAAWATFILCRYLTKSVWPAILAGYVFGFSPYFLAQILGGHLHLVLIFPVPIALYLAARWFDGAINSSTMACLVGLTLAAQFLLAVEIYATATMFAALAILLALGSTTGETNRRIVKMIGVLTRAYGLSLLIASPYIYYMFAYGQPRGEIWNAKQFSADLLNFVVPTDVNALGALNPMRALAITFPGNLFESDAYVGPVLIALAILYARRYWREPFGKTLIDSLVIICVLSLGPILQIRGHRLIGMPGTLLSVTPLISKALPTRFMMFAFLIFAIITAQWLAASEASVRKKCIVATLVVLFSLPNIDARYWISKSDTPEFFASGIYKKYLSPGEIVVVTPYSQHGNSMLWQAQSNFYFRMAGGWTGPIPAEYKQWPVVDALTGWTYLPDPQMQLMSFLANHQVGAIVVDNRDRSSLYFSQWMPAAAAIPLEIGGVTLYRIAPESLIPYRSTTAAIAERKADWALFSGVLAAVAKYQAEGRDPALLTPHALQSLGLYPPEWLGGAKFDFGLVPGKERYRGIWLSYVDKIYFGIGIGGSYDGLKPIIDRYSAYSYRIYFPFPRALAQGAHDRDRSIFIIFFNPEGLKRAIEATSSPAPVS